MKNSTRLFTAILLTAGFFVTNVKAQSTDPKWRVDFGPEVGITSAQIYQISSREYGATASIQYALNDNIALKLSSGYYVFSSPSATNTYTQLGNVIYVTPVIQQSVIPVTLGAKYFISKPFYFGLDTGVGFETQYSENKKLMASGGFGFQFDSFDIGAHYEDFSGQSYHYGLIGLHFKYGFSFGK